LFAEQISIHRGHLYSMELIGPMKEEWFNASANGIKDVFVNKLGIADADYGKIQGRLRHFTRFWRIESHDDTPAKRERNAQFKRMRDEREEQADEEDAPGVLQLAFQRAERNLKDQQEKDAVKDAAREREAENARSAVVNAPPPPPPPAAASRVAARGAGPPAAPAVPVPLPRLAASRSAPAMSAMQVRDQQQLQQQQRRHGV
jgi:hypothetical protein